MHSSALAATFLGLDIDDLAWLPGIPAPMSDQIVTDICLPKIAQQKQCGGQHNSNHCLFELCRLRGSSQGQDHADVPHRNPLVIPLTLHPTPPMHQDLADTPHRDPLVILVRPTHICHKDLFECTQPSSYTCRGAQIQAVQKREGSRRSAADNRTLCSNSPPLGGFILMTFACHQSLPHLTSTNEPYERSCRQYDCVRLQFDCISRCPV